MNSASNPSPQSSPAASDHVLSDSAESIRAIFETAIEGIMTIDERGHVESMNPAAAKMFGYAPEEVRGRNISMLMPAPYREEHDSYLANYARTGQKKIIGIGREVTGRRKDGSTFPMELAVTEVRLAAGRRFAGFIRDITERKQAEEKIKKQAQEILEMATVPVVQVWDGVVLVPLIGTLDSQRTQQLMERLLQRIADTASPVALVDITGVPAIDTQTAQHLIETISAVRLVGAEVVLTGVRPSIAQTLVHLGIELSNINTRSSLSAGLRTALEILNLQVVAKEGEGRKTPEAL